MGPKIHFRRRRSGLPGPRFSTSSPPSLSVPTSDFRSYSDPTSARASTPTSAPTSAPPVALGSPSDPTVGLPPLLVYTSALLTALSTAPNPSSVPPLSTALEAARPLLRSLLASPTLAHSSARVARSHLAHIALRSSSSTISSSSPTPSPPPLPFAQYETADRLLETEVSALVSHTPPPLPYLQNDTADRLLDTVADALASHTPLPPSSPTAAPDPDASPPPSAYYPPRDHLYAPSRARDAVRQSSYHTADASRQSSYHAADASSYHNRDAGRRPGFDAGNTSRQSSYHDRDGRRQPGFVAAEAARRSSCDDRDASPRIGLDARSRRSSYQVRHAAYPGGFARREGYHCGQPVLAHRGSYRTGVSVDSSGGRPMGR